MCGRRFSNGFCYRGNRCPVDHFRNFLILKNEKANLTTKEQAGAVELSKEIVSIWGEKAMSAYESIKQGLKEAKAFSEG